MMKKKISSTDVCFLVASSAKKSYQKLSETYAAIEPPTWALLLAQSCRSIGFSVSIIDANAENLSNNQILEKIKGYNERFDFFKNIKHLSILGGNLLRRPIYSSAVF